MPGKKHIPIRVASVIMLWLFTGIMATNLLCSFAHAMDATGQEHDHPYGHDHHHEGNNPLTEQDHKDTGHEHGHDSGQGCCNDFTFTFFSNLQRDHTPTLKLDSKVISFALLLPLFINPMEGKNLFKGVRDYIKPPPKIPDIRIFIQSFQI